MKFILLINIKMPTNVGILTLISRMNTTSENFKARKFFDFQHFSFYEQLKFHSQLSLIDASMITDIQNKFQVWTKSE